MSERLKKETVRRGDAVTRRYFSQLVTASPRLLRVSASLFLFLAMLIACSSCGSGGLFSKQEVQPKTLRDVPAQRLSYQFKADVQPPQNANLVETDDRVQAVENDFTNNRKTDALDRTVLSPDKQNVIAIYQSPDSARGEYQIDIYGVGGNLIRKITTQDVAVVSPSLISWSPGGNQLAFIARKSAITVPAPNEGAKLPGLEAPKPDETPGASPTSPTPFSQTIVAFPNEQIFICKSDGLDVRPLTLKIDQIYFYFVWSPDGTQILALACSETEEDQRQNDPEKRAFPPSGRIRLIDLKSNERVLDDALTDVLPVWSPDSSKVAIAFGTNVKIYDAGTDAPTQALAQLREQLITASRAYEETQNKTKQNWSGDASPSAKYLQNSNTAPVPSAEEDLPSFNPIVRLYWPDAKTLYLLTAYVRIFDDGPVSNFPRWHELGLNSQAITIQ